MTTELKPCPFCNQRLYIRKSANPYGRCETIGCWMHEAKLTVPLDDAVQVSAFNARAVPDVSDLEVIGFTHIGTINLLMHGHIGRASIAPTAGGNFDEPVVLHSQATAIIAAKDKNIALWKEFCGYYANKFAAERIKLNAAEAKLKKYEQQDPVAMRYDWDGYGFQYIDGGSGSDWQTRKQDAEPLYASPAPIKEQ